MSTCGARGRLWTPNLVEEAGSSRLQDRVAYFIFFCFGRSYFSKLRPSGDSKRINTHAIFGNACVRAYRFRALQKQPRVENPAQNNV